MPTKAEWRTVIAKLQDIELAAMAQPPDPRSMAQIVEALAGFLVLVSREFEKDAYVDEKDA